MDEVMPRLEKAYAVSKTRIGCRKHGKAPYAIVCTHLCNEPRQCWNTSMQDEIVLHLCDECAPVQVPESQLWPVCAHCARRLKLANDETEKDLS